MAEYWQGRRFSTREEDGLPPLSQAELDAANKAFDEYNEHVKALPVEERAQPSDHIDYFYYEEGDDESAPTNSDGELQ